jgi:hypothetical protein
VACATILSDWFCGQELALAFGLAMSLCKLGSVFNNWISPVVANTWTTPSALWVGLVVNGTGLLLTILILCFDRRYKKKVPVDLPSEYSLTEPLLLQGRSSTNGKDSGVIDLTSTSTTPAGDSNSGSDTRKLSPLFWLLSLSCLVVYGCILPFNNVASGILLE